MNESRRTELNYELDLLNIGCEALTGDELYNHQRDWYWRLETNEFNIAKKSRQLGFTFMSSGYYTLKAIQGETCLFVSPSLRQSGHVMEYANKWLNFYFDHCSGMDSYVVEHSKSIIRFSGGGALYALPNSASSIRGISARRIFFDEFAHFLHGTDKEVWEAILPSITTAKQKSIAVVSTPYGEGNLFWQMYNDRESFPGFNPVFYHYTEHPTLDITIIKANLDSLSFEQEYEGTFIGDMTTYFPLSLIRDCESKDARYWSLAEIAQCTSPIYGFMDVGKRMDFSCIILVADIGGKLKVIYKKTLKTPQEKEWDNQYAEVRTLLDTKRINRLMIDRTGIGDEISTRLASEYSQVIPFEFTNDNKGQMFPAFRKRLENQGVELPPDIQLFSALHMIERTQSGNSVVYGSSKHTDELGHADEGVALVGACYCYERESGTTTRMVGSTNVYGNRPGREAFLRGLERARPVHRR